MTTDKEHLQWMLNRLAEVHGENRNVDYMVRMQKIIDNTKTELNLHFVSDTVIYDNFGRDFTMPKEVYKISEVVKDGYLICNVYTKPFFAYGYQLKTYR